jgi:cell division transport system permease protein
MVFAVVLVVAGVTACGLFGHGSGPSTDQKLEKIIDRDPTFEVYLSYDATTAQRTGVEAALRALPGFRELTFVDRDAAYQQMKQLFSAHPSDLPDIKPETMPQSYRVRMTDVAAVRKVRDQQETVKRLPGVRTLAFPCLTPDECRQRFSPRPAATPS